MTAQIYEGKANPINTTKPPSEPAFATYTAPTTDFFGIAQLPTLDQWRHGEVGAEYTEKLLTISPKVST